MAFPRVKDSLPLPGITGLGYGSKYRPEEIRRLAIAAIARRTGIIVPSSSRADDIERIVSRGLLQGMGSQTTGKQRKYFTDTTRVNEIVGELNHLRTGDPYIDNQTQQYINAVLGVSAAVKQADYMNRNITPFGEKRYAPGVRSPAPYGHSDPFYKRSIAHGEAAPITPHETPPRRFHQGTIVTPELEEFHRRAQAHARYIPRQLATPAEYAGGDKPINYRPPNFMASGVARQAQTTAARMGTYTRDDFQMHEPIKLANGKTMYIPSHLTTSSSRLRDWIVKEYVENKDPNVRILVDYAEEHRLQGQGLGNEFHKGLVSAEIHIAREMSKPKWGEGPKEAKYEYRRNTFGDRMFKPAPSATGQGKLRDPVTGKRLVIGKMRGWGDALKEKIPYGQFRGMRVGDLLNPILKTHRNKKTGKRYQSTSHEAIYYVAGMKNSEWVKQSFPQFHAIIHHYFTHNPAMRELLAPYEDTNYFGGRSQADLRIKYNPYRPSTWGHGHNVSLRDDDLPYYDRWTSADRGHKLGYDIRKQTPQWVDEEISLVLKSTLPGWMKRRMIADISQAEEGQETRRTVAQKSWSRLKGLREKEQGVHWAPDPENEGNFIRVKGPKEISTREQRIEKLVERMNVKQGRMLLNVGRIQAASDKYDIQGEVGGVIGKGRRVEMFTQQERERIGMEDPFTEVEHQMLSGARVRSQKKGDMSKARPVPKNFEELLAARLSYQRKIDWVVKNGGTLEQLQNLAEDVETTVPGGWPALDRAQGLVDFNKLEGGAPDDVYPADPEAEIYQTDTSLRGYFFKARALIMARE